MQSFRLLAMMGLFFSLGCTSFRTTMVSRFENDTLYKDPCQSDCLKGVPVKLKVPTHITARIYEEQILIQKTTKADDGTVKGVKSKLVSFDSPQVRVETELFYTDKVFLVDFLRPAAGTLSLLGAGTEDGVAFDDEQYFSKLKASVQERTLRDITNVISTFPNTASATAQTVSNVQVPLPAGVSTQESLIAFRRFDLADPDWEIQMQCFIDEQLRRCGSCEPGSHAQLTTPPAPVPAAEIQAPDSRQ